MTSTIRKNILANYIGQIYVTLVGFIMVPMYMNYMGSEQFGLIGFFATLQSCFQLLDMGFTSTMARETARFKGGANDPMTLRRLLRAMEVVFICIAVIGGSALVAGSSAIASSWLKVQQLQQEEVEKAIMLMGVIVALRWVSGLYRGVINGFESLVWLNGFNIAVATVRFVLVIPFFIYVGTSPTQFFCYQFVLTVIEVLVLVRQTYRLLPKNDLAMRTPWQLTPLLGLLKFSLNMALAGMLWILATQTDKLLLSKLLPLSDFAYFTLVSLVAAGITSISSPISSIVMLRMTSFHALGDMAGLIKLYRNATQLISIFSLPAALLLVFFSEQVLWAWTGNSSLAKEAASVLTLYAIGYGIMTYCSFPYYLQYAIGDLKLHLIGSIFFTLLLIPSLIWSTRQFGMVGAGFTWLIANLIYFLICVPVVHYRFVPGIHWTWLLRDIILTCAPVIFFAWLIQHAISWSNDRLELTAQLFILGTLFMGIICLSSSYIRSTLINRVSIWMAIRYKIRIGK